MTIKTTKATLDHLQTIIDFNYQLFLHDIPFDNLLFKEWPYSEDGKEYFTKAITNNNYCAFIATENERVIGYLVGYIWNHWTSRPVKTAEIDNMLVLESHRGRGVGKLLINEFKNWCKENQVVDMFVMAYSGNTDAIEFYKKNGFEDLSVRLHQTVS